MNRMSRSVTIARQANALQEKPVTTGVPLVCISSGKGESEHDDKCMSMHSGGV